MFDSQIFCHQRFGGVSRYISNMVIEMAKMADVLPRVIAPVHCNEYLRQVPRAFVYGRKIGWLEGATALTYAANLIAGRRASRRFAPDITHNTYYFPASPPPNSKMVVTVHDMIHEQYPRHARANPLIAYWKAQCVARAAHVLCVSEHTRQDLLAANRIAEDRVSVTHLGYDDFSRYLMGEASDSFKKRVLGADTPYLLFVGSRGGYKNFSALLRAYATSPRLNRHCFLVCFGGGAFSLRERRAIARAGVADRVKHVGGSDDVLANCYAHASLYVCPSLYEGFGIPVLEAMSLGCPVACSDSSSLPEVAGNAAMLFDAKNIESVRFALESVLDAPSQAALLVERGRSHCKKFSWKACAERTAGIYRRILA